MWNQTKGFLFLLFPHHLVSRFTFWLTRLQTPLKNPAIRLFIRAFDVDMSESEHQSAENYISFNQFFTRKLIAGSRPIDNNTNTIACPADGRISQISHYKDGQVIQAKGQNFSISQLLGGKNNYGTLCESGNFATIYLSPRNYHRVHMPYDGELVEMIYIPGRLFSVAPYSAEVIKGLYSRNERVASIFKTEVGYMAVVMVGAVNVAAIEMAWEGLVTPPHGKNIVRKTYGNVKLKKGDELGVFNMGSTAIMAFEENKIEWHNNLQLQQAVQMGQTIGATLGEVVN
ncbi:MAG: phosphatidylserine decarboxylase [Gammaproteobacteria bacterium]|nr:MAG: phosphatidylserine decarboxylase [Gammaproteobacteria bacterium]